MHFSLQRLLFCYFFFKCWIFLFKFPIAFSSYCLTIFSTTLKKINGRKMVKWKMGKKLHTKKSFIKINHWNFLLASIFKGKLKVVICCCCCWLFSRVIVNKLKKKRKKEEFNVFIHFMDYDMSRLNKQIHDKL